MVNNYSRYTNSFIHQNTRTIEIADPALAPEGMRFVNVSGQYPGASDAIYGVTLYDRNRPGAFQSAPVVPAITATAKTVGERFTLTAAQAANVGGRAGIYQVRTAFTPAALILTAIEGQNVFYVGSELRPESSLKEYGFNSETPLFPSYDKTSYQKLICVGLSGLLNVEAGVAITKGQYVGSNTLGQAITVAASGRIAGIAMNNAAVGEYVQVEMIVGR
jgi:hypothetical protein